METILTDGSATFTPAQAGRLTGVDPGKQANWRQRGVLPKGDTKGWNRFNIWGLLSLTFIAEAGGAGIDLNTARDMAGVAVEPMAKTFLGQPAGRRFVAYLSNDGASEIVAGESLSDIEAHIAGGFWAERGPTAIKIIDAHAVATTLRRRIDDQIHVPTEQRTVSEQ